MPSLYPALVRPLLFRMDPERVHNLTLRACDFAGRSALLRTCAGAACGFSDPRLRQTLAGIEFQNPIGLAAGFDKNGHAVGLMGSFGFGHVEVGSVSAYPSDGNRRPRLFRIPADEGIVVHYGVPNEGAEAVAARLARKTCEVPLGINLVKTNDPSRPNTDDEVIGDYVRAFARLQGLADYMTLNLSCPNSANDRNFFDELGKLQFLLRQLEKLSPEVPVFLKLKPTLDRGFLSEIVAIADAFPFIAGFGINLPAGKPKELNLKTSRETLAKMPGAVSGRPVEDFINANLKLLSSLTGPAGRYRLMAAGGVYTAEDAYRKIRLGASLVQLYTAMVYRGPGVVGDILKGLCRLLEQDGFGQIAAAVGIDRL